MTDIPMSIDAHSRFGSLINTFSKSFEDGEEHGASFCAYQHGELIVDLKGGWADRKKTQPLTDNTLIAVFSSGKAVAALVLACLVDDDRIGYETVISSLWPEFSGGGKSQLTIGQILSHQHGLPGITNPYFKAEDWLNWDLVMSELAAQSPIFTPGTQSGYSPITYGFFAGEIARRCDPLGRTLGQILREDICAAHALDIWIGLPLSEHERCADMIKPRRASDFGDITPSAKSAFLEPWSSPGRVGVQAWRSAELAGSNCHATAKSLAKIMQMAVDGSVGGEQYLAEDTLRNLRMPRISGQDQVLPFELSIGAGVMLNSPNFFYGPNAQSVGHSGWGGSCVFADPVTGISCAYAMTRQDNSLMGDPRALRLIDTLYRGL